MYVFGNFTGPDSSDEEDKYNFKDELNFDIDDLDCFPYRTFFRKNKKSKKTKETYIYIYTSLLINFKKQVSKMMMISRKIYKILKFVLDLIGLNR